MRRQTITFDALLQTLPYCATPIGRTDDGQIQVGRAGAGLETATTATYPDAGWRCEAERALLWQLEDWRVSSVAGGVIWLTRR